MIRIRSIDTEPFLKLRFIKFVGAEGSSTYWMSSHCHGSWDQSVFCWYESILRRDDWSSDSGRFPNFYSQPTTEDSCDLVQGK